MAEAHPVGFRWVMKAKERGATIIHVDPDFRAPARWLISGCRCARAAISRFLVDSLGTL